MHVSIDLFMTTIEKSTAKSKKRW